MNHATTHHEISLEWEYTVTPGYPATRYEPAELPDVEISRVDVNIRGKRYPAPHWLVEELLTDDLQSKLIEAADARRENAA
jgi:hypothetical protein